MKTAKNKAVYILRSLWDTLNRCINTYYAGLGLDFFPLLEVITNWTMVICGERMEQRKNLYTFWLYTAWNVSLKKKKILFLSITIQNIKQISHIKDKLSKVLFAQNLFVSSWILPYIPYWYLSLAVCYFLLM